MKTSKTCGGHLADLNVNRLIRLGRVARGRQLKFAANRVCALYIRLATFAPGVARDFYYLRKQTFP